MIKYIVLGITQGFTEFLPVSSSGHLVVLQKVFGINSNQVAISVVLHLGTLLAVIVFFWKDILAFLGDLKLLALAALVTLITGGIGILGQDFFESLFVSTRAVALAWVFTGLLLISTRKITRLDRKKLNAKDALILGIAQGLAVIPGISRSGITISTLFFRKITRQLAFTFSFLVSIPVILGAAALEARKIGAVPAGEIKNLAVGFIFSFIAGLLALLFLRSIINKSRFYYFGYYCILMAAITLLFIR